MAAINRRDFLKASGAVGGGLILPATAEARSEAAGAFPLHKPVGEVPTICTYCAVGCGQIVGVQDGRVVKGVNFVNLRDARDPVEAATTYCQQGADELVFLDIFATVQNRKTRLEWVKRVCDVVTVPFAVGGGIGSIEDMKALIDLGVDKVSINTAAVKTPNLIKETSKKFGKKRLVVAIDGYRPAPSSVIDKGIDSFLDHALFIADDNTRCPNLQQVV